MLSNQMVCIDCFLGSSAGKESTYNAGDLGSISRSWRSAGEGIGYCLQYLGDSDGKESACNAGNLGLIPGLGRSPGEGNSYPLQYSGLENSMDRGAWQATVHGVAKNWTWLSSWHIHSNKLVPHRPWPTRCTKGLTGPWETGSSSIFAESCR